MLRAQMQFVKFAIKKGAFSPGELRGPVAWALSKRNERKVGFWGSQEVFLFCLCFPRAIGEEGY